MASAAAPKHPPTKRTKVAEDTDDQQPQPLTVVLVQPNVGKGMFCRYSSPDTMPLFDRLYDALVTACDSGDFFVQEEVKMWGKKMQLPRLVAHLGESYHFSGEWHDGEPFDAAVERQDAVGIVSRELLPLIPHWARLAASIGGVEHDWAPNECIINRYDDGKNTIGLHSDNEGCLASSTVVMLTLGAERVWHLKSLCGRSLITDRPRHGDLHVMSGPLQSHYKHGMPKCVNDSIRPHKDSLVRFSLTFRKMKPSPAH